MLGLGLGNNKSNQKSGYKGLLDDLNIVDSFVLGFANEKLTKDFDGFAYLLYRVSDAETRYFYFNQNGEIDSTEILTWLNGSVGKVKAWGNQADINYPAYQDNPDYMPAISDGIEIYPNGILFDGVDDFLIIDDYTAIQIINPDLNIYMDMYSHNTSGVAFSKNQNNSSLTQYDLVFSGALMVYCIMEGSVRHGTPVFYNGNAKNTVMFDWSNNTATMNCNGIALSNTYSNTITNRPEVRIGCLHTDVGEDRFMHTNIKTLMIFNQTQQDNYDNFVNEL